MVCLVTITWEAGLGEQRLIRSSGHLKAGGFLCFTAGLHPFRGVAHH
jgi:hypothetical protein